MALLKNPKGKVTRQWWSDQHITPGRVRRKELNDILNSFKEAGLGDRSMTVLSTQGCSLGTLVLMVGDESSSEYIIFMPNTEFSIRYYQWTHPEYDPNDKNSFKIYLPHRLAKVEGGTVYHMKHSEFGSNYWARSTEFESEEKLVNSPNWKLIDKEDPKRRQWMESFAADAPLEWRD